MFAVAQFGVDVVLYGYATFLPTIIQGLGSWSIAQVQALTVSCYVLGALTYLVVAWLSDRSQRRAAHVGFGFVSAAGYAVLLSLPPAESSISAVVSLLSVFTLLWKFLWYHYQVTTHGMASER